MSDGSAPAGDAVTAAIVAFLREIGLDVEIRALDGPTFLPGIAVERGGLVVDPAALTYPGDLLHEAGHLAVKPAAERQAAAGNVGSDPAEEMMAIAWSYAAALQLGIAPGVVFHAAGYRGGSQSLVENFAEGRFLALPMLQWVGLAFDERRAAEAGVPAYPHMLRWLRDA